MSEFHDATKRWMQSLEDRKRSGKRKSSVMSPWDEMAYFDLPVTRFFTGSIVTPFSIAVANPRRVVLMFGGIGGQSQVGPQDQAAVLAGGGFPVNATTNAFTVIEAEHGILCQVEWFAVVPLAGAILTVTEVFLREFP